MLKLSAGGIRTPIAGFKFRATPIPSHSRQIKLNCRVLVCAQDSASYGRGRRTDSSEAQREHENHKQTSSARFQCGSLDGHAGTRRYTQKQSDASLCIRTRLCSADPTTTRSIQLGWTRSRHRSGSEYSFSAAARPELGRLLISIA